MSGWRSPTAGSRLPIESEFPVGKDFSVQGGSDDDHGEDDDHEQEDDHDDDGNDCDTSIFTLFAFCKFETHFFAFF